MNLNCEYMMKVQIDNLIVSETASETEIKEKILLQGRKMLLDYFNNLLFDPKKKIFFELTNYELNLETNEPSTSH